MIEQTCIAPRTSQSGMPRSVGISSGLGRGIHPRLARSLVLVVLLGMGGLASPPTRAESCGPDNASDPGSSRDAHLCLKNALSYDAARERADASRTQADFAGAGEQRDFQLLETDKDALFVEIDAQVDGLLRTQDRLEELEALIARSGDDGKAMLRGKMNRERAHRSALLDRMDTAMEALRDLGVDVGTLEAFIDATLAEDAHDTGVPLTGGGQRFQARASEAGYVPSAAAPFSRGHAWVRENPMFISALNVSMGQPPGEFVDQYFDAFHANAFQLWVSGLPFEAQGWRSTGHPNVPWVSWTFADGTSSANRQLIGGLSADPPGRIGYQIGDEPEDMTELLQIEAGVDAVRQADPDALLIVNFSDELEDIDGMLEYFGDNVDADIISHDSYTRSQKAYARLEKFRAAGLDFGMPYWRYLRAFEFAGDDDWPSRSDMRWNAFSGLVYGYTGQTWFIYQARPVHGLETAFFRTTGDFGSPKTSRFDYAAQINREMANLGSAVTKLTSTDVRYLSSLSRLQPDGTRAWQSGAGNDPYITRIEADGSLNLQDLLVGFFEDDHQEKYFMFQNVNHSSGEFPSWGQADADVEVVFDFSAVTGSTFDKNRLQSISPATGLVEELPLKPLQGDQRKLELTLKAGDPVLLTYKIHSSAGVRVGGLDPSVGACLNWETEQLIVTNHGLPMYRCGDERLLAEAGAPILAGMVGTVKPPSFPGSPGLTRQEPVTGQAAGLDVIMVLCQNYTSEQLVVIDDGSATWDCSAAGLDVAEGDLVMILVAGLVPGA